MDGTQTTEPTEAGPGFVPVHASAYRRALDDQAMTEGPLDLTVPLNIVEVRKALSATGPLRKVGLAAYNATAKGASAAAARPQDGRGGIHARRFTGPRHMMASKRLGRIFAFVAVTATLSVGTAWALVASNNAQNTSVSLPAAGAIPQAPSTGNPQPGRGEGDSGSTTAPAAPGPSRTTGRQLPVGATTSAHPTPTHTASGTQSATPSASASAGGSPSAGSPTSTPPIFGPPPSAGGNNQWQVLSANASQSSQQQQETVSVQSLLLNLGFLEPWHRRAFADPNVSVYTVSPDPSGYYGAATANAIAEFQQAYGVDFTDQAGQCDAETYQALVQIYEQAESD